MGGSERWTRLRRALLLPLLSAGAVLWLIGASPDSINRGWWGKTVLRARKVLWTFKIPAGAPVFAGRHAGFHRTLTCRRFMGEHPNGELEELWISWPDCRPPRVRIRQSAERIFVHRTVVLEWDLMDLDPKIVQRGVRRFRRRRRVGGLSDWACEKHRRDTGESLARVWLLQRVDRQHFVTGEKQQLVHAIHQFDCETHTSVAKGWPAVHLDADGRPEFE